MSDLIVARRENGCAAMSVGESGLAPALADGSVGAGAAPRAAVHPERFGLVPAGGPAHPCGSTVEATVDKANTPAR